MRLVIVEDQTFIRETISRVCVEGFRHEVVGEAETGADGLRITLEQNPDVLILDLGLPDFSGLIVAAQVRGLRPDVRVLVLSGLLDDVTVYRTEKLGVHGFIDKNSDPIAALRAAFHALGTGGTWFSPTFHAVKRARHADPFSFTKILSNTELRVLAEISEGLNDVEIADRLGITRTTAQTHRSHILRKLEIDSTPKLVAYAIKRGLVRNGTGTAPTPDEGRALSC